MALAEGKIIESQFNALGIAVEIPALRVCKEICSTDCHALLAMTDCSGKPDPQGNAHQKGGQAQSI